MKKGILFIFILGLFNCGKSPNIDSGKQEEPKQLVSDTVIYEFINFILGPQSEFMNGYCNIVANGEGELKDFLTKDSILLDDRGVVLSKDDIKFIKEQTELLNYFKLDSFILPNHQIIPTDIVLKLHDPNKFLEFWEDLRNKFMAQGYCTISLPLFSMDRSIAIVEIGYHCGGLCGNGGIYIYQKVMGEWKLKETLSQWIS